MNICQNIDIVVQSKYPEVLAKFKKGFLNTTKGIKNIRLHEITGKNYGAGEINKILSKVFTTSKYFGVFNDDVWFSEGWLEDCLRLLKDNHCVSAGYVDTDNKECFKKAVELTQNETNTVDFLYGANYIFQTPIFKEIGMFDERFDWSCNDLDWTWRLLLNGMKSVTSKKITMAHIGFVSLWESRERRHSGKRNKIRFMDKHGYQSYIDLRNLYREYHKYFRDFSKYENPSRIRQMT